MARILSVWLELPDKADANALVISVQKILGDGALVQVQENVPYVPDDAPVDVPAEPAAGGDV